MRIARDPALVPWYTIAEVASDWGWSPENILAAATSGHFQLVRRTDFGMSLLTMAAEDRERFEAAHPEKTKPRELRADARQSYVELLAVVMADCYGNDPALLLKPYERAAALERLAAAAGIPLARGTKTLAEILGAAGEHLEKCGYAKRPAITESENAA
jgi:hypothetical protein